MSSWPIIGNEERKNVLEVLDSNVLWKNQGTYVKKFEKYFLRALKSEYGLAITNGTHGIELALSAANIGYGDEVLIPGVSFYSTLSAVINVNAIPKYVDVNPNTGVIDVDDLIMKLDKKTKAIIVVHLWGIPCDVGTIRKICEEYNIILIEDCAHVGPEEFNNRTLGTYGDFGVFSFQNAKLLSAGEGGFVVIKNKEIYDRAKLIANCGRTEEVGSYWHEELGSNYRMTELQGACLLGQLTKYDEQKKKREDNANYIVDQLKEIDEIAIFPKELIAQSSNYMLIMQFTKGSNKDLMDLLDYCFKRNVNVNRVYPPLNSLPFVKSGNFNNRLSTKMSEIIVKRSGKVLKNSQKFYDISFGVMHFHLLSLEYSMHLTETIKGYFK